MSRLNFILHRIKLHVDYLCKPSSNRKRLVRKYGHKIWYNMYTNKYWKFKADKFRARFPNEI